MYNSLVLINLNQLALVKITMCFYLSSCPTAECQKARPFTTPQPITTARPTQTLSNTTLPTGASEVTDAPFSPRPPVTTAVTPAVPPIHEQICIESTILPKYQSALGQSYCEFTCLKKKMDFCNLFLCTCITKFDKQFGDIIDNY